jgi:hypothetical protein
MTSPAVIAAGLRAHAQGLCCLEAAAELLIAQTWLHRDDFTSRFITVHPESAADSRRPSSTGPPRSPRWARAFPAPEASSGC